MCEISSARSNGRRPLPHFRLPSSRESASWPTGQGTEVTIGSEIDGKKVVDFVWSVHVANKKANTFVLVDDGDRQGIAGFGPGPLPPSETPTSAVTPEATP